MRRSTIAATSSSASTSGVAAGRESREESAARKLGRSRFDDTCDVVHGNQQLALFNAHYDERCFLPIHVYDTATARPVAVLLRPGKTPTERWWESELAGCSFADPRLGQRLRKLIERMGGAMGASLPLACQDWASTKAAYRFFSNDRVGEDQILAGHFHSTRERFAAAPGSILVLQDTTEFIYQRERSEAIGVTYSVNSGRDKAGRVRNHTVCGLLMHSSLAVTTEGLPLGVTAVKFWSRQKFKGTAALKLECAPGGGQNQAAALTPCWVC